MVENQASDARGSASHLSQLEPIEMDCADFELEQGGDAVHAGARAAPGTFFELLIPGDILERLNALGEIDLYDADGRLVEPCEELSAADLEEVLDDDTVVEELFDAAPVERAAGLEEVVDALSRLPLFADLDLATLQTLAEGASVQLVDDRGYVFREGELAATFFLVEEGALEALKRTATGEVVLHQLRRGDAFGIFGLLAGQRRSASVRCIGSAEIIAISDVALARAMASSAVARKAVQRLFTERLLENFLGSSPLFTSLSAVARGLLISQFQERKLKPGERIVSPGEVFNGLFLVLSGRLSISRRQAAAREDQLASLGRGEFFGLVSALSGHPCRCTVAAEDETTVVMLPQKAFNDFVKDYPILRQLPARLAQQGLLVDRDVFTCATGIPGLS